MAKSDETPQAPAMPAGLTQEQLLSMFLELQARQVALQEQQARAVELQEVRSRPKDNPNYQATSIFLKPGTGEGRPWTEDLKCDMYLGSMHLNKTPLTQVEVAALNQLQPVDRARLVKVDRSEVRASVIPTFNDVTNKLEKLEIQLPMKKDDNPQHYPPLDELVLQLVKQAQPVAA